MKRCFITQQVPPDLVVKFNISQAGVNFCNHLVQNKMFDAAFALPILSIVPNIMGECINDKNYTYIQYRLFPHKGIGKLLNALIENFKCAFLVRNFKHIWFYNVNKQTILLYIIVKYILFKKVYILVADFRPGKKISINSIIKTLIDKSNGIITLSMRSIFKNLNSICIPGIVPLEKLSEHSIPIQNRSFLLSGVLKEATGISMAIDIFAHLPNERLYITGILEQKYIEKINLYPNIIYKGYLEYDEYKQLIQDIPFGLSLRDPSFAINRNNFPSKILEYFAMNKIVISTIDYPEINGLHFFKANYELIELSKLIEDISVMKSEELNYYRNHSQFLKEHFSEKAWKKAFDNIESH